MSAPAIQVDAGPPRSAGRRRRVPPSVWVPLLALLAATVVPGLLLTGRRDPVNGVMLPDSIAGHAPLTSTAESVPAGTALLLYHSGNAELYHDYQALLLGVDGRTYRQIASTTLPSAHRSRSVHLAPDGNAVLSADSYFDGKALTRVDLRTGAIREYPMPPASAVLVLAWSPDLRTVAVAVSREIATGGTDYASRGQLSLLDLATGALTAIPELGNDVVAAGFAPDSTKLVVQTASRTVIVDHGGTVQRELTLSPGTGVLPSVAWSPDGGWIATVPYDGLLHRWRPALGRTIELRLVDATGGDRPARATSFSGTTIVGWRDPGHLIELEYPNGGFETGGALSEVSLADGSVRQLATFEHPHNCEFFTQPCRVEADVQAATSLLSQMALGPTGWLPDRGPASGRLYLITLVLALWVTIVLARRYLLPRRALSSASEPDFLQ